MNKSAELRKQLLDEAKPIIDYVCATALDRSKIDPGVDQVGLSRIWEAVIPILQKANDISAINAASTADVIQLLADGKITLTDAKDLILIVNGATAFDPNTPQQSLDINIVDVT